MLRENVQYFFSIFHSNVKCSSYDIIYKNKRIVSVVLIVEKLSERGKSERM